MALAWCAVRRSASKFASVCGGRVPVISTEVSRPSLALNPSQLRSFVSRSLCYPTVIDQLSSEQTLIREIDSQINYASHIYDYDMVNDEEATPGLSLPFKMMEDDGGKTVTLTRDYKGEQIKVVVGMPFKTRDDDDCGDDYDDNDYGDDDDDNELRVPLTLNVTKKSGLSLVFRCTVADDYIDIIDDVFVDHPGDSSIDQLLNIVGTDHFKDVNHNLHNAFDKYLETRLTKGTLHFLYEYMTTNKRRHLLWLKYVKKFLDDQSSS